MIILFSSCLGLTAVKSKRKQIEYIELLIHIGNRILLMLKSTVPETEEIIRQLKRDQMLEDFDFTLKFKSTPLSKRDNQKVADFFNAIGMYDIDTQIMLAAEFTGYFKMLNKQYRDYYDRHYKLYIVFGIASGLLLSVILM